MVCGRFCQSQGLGLQPAIRVRSWHMNVFRGNNEQVLLWEVIQRVNLVTLVYPQSAPAKQPPPSRKTGPPPPSEEAISNKRAAGKFLPVSRKVPSKAAAASLDPPP